MSAPRIITWLPINTTLIASTQALAAATAAGNLQLNSSVPGQLQGAFIYDKVIRQVQLISTGTTAATFKITGIGSPVDGNGNPTQVVSLISENIVGLTANTAKNSLNIYQQIISISYTGNNANANITVGSGPAGITDFVFLNYNSVFGFANCSIQFINQATISAAAYTSLNKPQIVDQNAGNLISSPFLPRVLIASGSVDAWDQIQTPVSVVWLTVAATTTDSLNFTVLQQGVYP